MNDHQQARFQQVMAEFEAPFRRLCSSYERDADLQRDLFQEIAFAVWRALPTFRNGSSERTFLYRIAHNRALTYIARRRPESLEIEYASEIADPSLSPEAMLLQRTQYGELLARVAALPLSLRQVSTLALEGLSNSEISEIVGISEGNVAVRLSRARNRLKAGGPKS